jgi:L-rhamnose mutarotase
MNKHILLLDLVDEETSIKQYEAYHEKIPAAIEDSIRSSGIKSMEIYRFSNRLVMEIQVEDTFSFASKAAADQENPDVQAWENLMNQFQQRIPGSQAHEKWVVTNRIFRLI